MAVPTQRAVLSSREPVLALVALVGAGQASRGLCPHGGGLPALARPSSSSGALRRLQQHLAWGGTGREAARGKLAIATSRRSQGSPLGVWVGPPLRGVLSLESGVGQLGGAGWSAPSKITRGGGGRADLGGGSGGVALARVLPGL